MLPPIQSVSNMSVQHKVPPRQENDGHARGGQEQGARNREGQEPVVVSNAATGRVNILNLAGSEVITRDLSRLSEVIARALDLPAAPGENPLMHALRLAEAILKLNPGPRMALERQLAHILQGLSLDLVAQALKNPGGAEAARIAAYLELGNEDGDLATEAVVASYQQNEVSEEDSLLSLALRSARPEIALNDAGDLLGVENLLSQAAAFAAQRAGIALPYVNAPFADIVADDEEVEERRDHHGEDAGEEAESEAHDRQAADQGAAEGEDAAIALPLDEETVEADERAYVYYQRMSGGL